MNSWGAQTRPDATKRAICRQGPNLRTPRVAWLDSQPLRVLEERVRRKSRVSSRRAEFAHPTRQSRHLLAPVGCQNSVSPANAVIREGRSESWHLTGADSPASASEASGRPIMRSSPHLRVYFRIGAGVVAGDGERAARGEHE